jgi:hypothetical protein
MQTVAANIPAKDRYSSRPPSTLLSGADTPMLGRPTNHAETDRADCKLSGSNYCLAWPEIVGPDQVLGELVNTESERDQGNGGSDPGHERPVVGEESASAAEIHTRRHNRSIEFGG